MPVVTRKSHLRQGIAFPTTAETVQTKVAEAVANCGNVKQSQFTHSKTGEEVQLRHRAASDGFLFLHFGTFEPGGTQTTLPDPGAKAEAATSEQAPRKGSEFARSELAVIIYGDLVAYSIAGHLREMTVSRLLSDFVSTHAEKVISNGEHVDCYIELTAKVDESEVKRLIEKRGVSELVLNASIDEGLIGSLKQKRGKIAGLLSALSTFIQSDHSASTVTEKASLLAALSFKVGRNGTPVDSAAISEFASQATEEELLSGVGFRTNDGSWYSASKLLISESFKQQRGPIDVQAAWTAGRKLISEHINANFIVKKTD